MFLFTIFTKMVIAILKLKCISIFIVLVSAFSKTENLKNKRIYFICPFSLYVTNILQQYFKYSNVFKIFSIYQHEELMISRIKYSFLKFDIYVILI